MARTPDQYRPGLDKICPHRLLSWGPPARPEPAGWGRFLELTHGTQAGRHILTLNILRAGPKARSEIFIGCIWPISNVVNSSEKQL